MSKLIFLSHNHRDKSIVEPIAIRIKQIFGQDNVFYDSWSIQPGDGIIDKMNIGLENCSYFFLFASKNSITSEMVKLEWQNALLKAIKGDLRIIPVRIDTVFMPAVLLQNLYLDLFTNGIEIVLKQMVDVINGNNTFTPQFGQFSNLSAKVYEIEKGLNIEIVAKHYMEPRSHYLTILDNSKEEASVGIRGSGMVQSGFKQDIKLNNGVRGNGWLISISQATIPGFPLELIVNKITEAQIKLIMIMHEVEKDRWQSIPIENHMCSR